MDLDLHDDWELLDVSDSPPLHLHTTTYLDGIERDSEGVIRPDYFSLHYSPSHHPDHHDDQISVDSDNPSWIDPVDYSKTKPIGEPWSTDSSDGVESEASNNESKHNNNFDYNTYDEPSEAAARREGDESRVAVWWKLPLDMLKYCLFKASPVWTLSVAAAMMGVVILGRRLYKMKQKTRRLQLKLTIDDDKKVSQVMSRAARLNEAFSVVKRVPPMIRPSLPATGIAPWPVMALR